MSVIYNTQIATSTSVRKGVNIDGFALNSSVNFNRYNLNANFEETDNKVQGIYFNGNTVGAGTTINVGDSDFNVTAKNSHCIFFDNGNFPLSSTTEIFVNRFQLSASSGASNYNQRCTGIELRGPKYNNFSIKWNSFTSNEVIPFPYFQNNNAIYLQGNGQFGTNNEIGVNGFNYSVDYLNTCIYANGFPNVEYSCNNMEGYNFTRGCVFSSSCNGTKLIENTISLATFLGGASGHVYVTGSGIMDPQNHTGNQFNNLFGIESTQHARCDGDPELNKFNVHTDQSTCAANTPSNPNCFNAFHPKNVIPDVDDEFFEKTTGSPSTSCGSELTNPEPSAVDLMVGQGLFTSPSAEPVQGWIQDRYLYHKLSKNAGLVSGHPSFPTFLANKANTSVEKLYQVYSSIEAAFNADPLTDANSQQALDNITALQASLANVDQQIEDAINNNASTTALFSSKESLMAQINAELANYDTLNANYEVQRNIGLQTAYNLNELVPTSTSGETKEKAYNRIYLTSLMQQNGTLNSSQIAELQAIASGDPKLDGPVVNDANGLLPDCYKIESNPPLLISAGIEDVQVQSFDELQQAIANFNPQAPVFNVFPNPVRTEFTVQNPTEHNGAVEVFDIAQKLMLSTSINGKFTTIGLTSEFRPGIYIVRVRMEDGRSFTDKLIVH